MASFDFEGLGLLKQKRIIFCVISEILLVFTLMRIQPFDCLTETWDCTEKYFLKSPVSASYICDKIRGSKSASYICDKIRGSKSASYICDKIRGSKSLQSCFSILSADKISSSPSNCYLKAVRLITGYRK